MWVLTHDFLDDKDIRKFSIKAAGSTMEQVAKRKAVDAACIQPFQLRDDDHILYFEARATDEQSMLDCLDNFGSGYGCTEVWTPSTEHKGLWAPIN